MAGEAAMWGGKLLVHREVPDDEAPSNIARSTTVHHGDIEAFWERGIVPGEVDTGLVTPLQVRVGMQACSHDSL